MDDATIEALPRVKVMLPRVLREKFGGGSQIIIAGLTVRTMIDTLDAAYPGLGFHLCHETGELRPYVNIFLNRDDIRSLQGLDTPLPDGATIHILQSVAGGS